MNAKINEDYLTTLEQLATAAKETDPTPWSVVTGDEDGDYVARNDGYSLISENGSGEAVVEAPVAAFIAHLDPDKALALVAEVRRLHDLANDEDAVERAAIEDEV